MSRFRRIRRLPQFEKDLKRLLKRFRTLEEDLDTFIDTQLVLYHKLCKSNKGIVEVTGLGFREPRVFKARKFACRALKGTASSSGIRIIYFYSEEEDTVELIEIYYKGDKKNEDRERILKRYRR